MSGGTAHTGVVVGYDASASATPALAWAVGEAVRRGSPLTVLYAADFGDAAITLGADVQGLAHQIADEGVAAARLMAGTMGAELDVTSGSTLGGATAALVEASQSADLLVLGNRGRGALAGALLGSVAFSVTAAARCPVVVVRTASSGPPGPHAVSAPGPGCPVVVGVDDLPSSLHAVTFAAQTADRAGAPLQVVAAWQSPEVVDAGFAALDYQAITDAAHWAAQDAAKAGAEVVRAEFTHVEVDEVVVQHPAGQALVEASQGAGLVVVGARGHGSVTGMFLGSVSHAPIHRTLCPVAVVRPAVARHSA